MEKTNKYIYVVQYTADNIVHKTAFTSVDNIIEMAEKNWKGYYTKIILNSGKEGAIVGKMDNREMTLGIIYKLNII